MMTHSSRFISTLLLGFVAAGLLGLLSGCDNPDIVVHEYVKQTRPKGRKLGPPRDFDSRMVVAIYQNDNMLWTFKIVASIPAMKDESRWRPFVESIEFDESGKPKWELPEGWTEGGSSQFVYSKISIPGEPPLEISVSDLPAGQDLEANVNRWRGQLSLPPISDPIDNHVVEKSVETKNGKQQILVYDENGFSGSGGMRPTQPAMPEFTPGKVDYSLPEGWTTIESTSPLVKKFEKSDGENKIEVSITQLPGNPITWNQVATMWSNQLELEELTEKELSASTEIIETEAFSGKRIRMDSSESSAADQQITILGVMIEKDERTWFVKLIGNREFVDSENDNFAKFVDSIKFE